MERLTALTLLAALSVGLALPLHAQTPAPAQADPVRTLEQKTERITHEDKGSRIEELRVGGETRRIEVQTKSGLPGYEVQPDSTDQPANSLGQRTGNAGKASWRVLSF